MQAEKRDDTKFIRQAVRRGRWWWWWWW